MIIITPISATLRRLIARAGERRTLTTTATPEGIEVGPLPLTPAERTRVLGLLAADATDPLEPRS